MRPDDQEAVRRFAAWKHRPRQPGSDATVAPTAQSIYAKLMKETFAPWLRAAGFRGSGGRFELPSGSHWVQLGFQKSVYSDRHELRFTVNLLCISRAEWESLRAKKPYLGARPQPGTFYGDWVQQTRIGKLTLAGEDKWWCLQPGQDFEPVIADLLHDIHNYGIPWLRAASADT